jgi:hypothetical protein
MLPNLMDALKVASTLGINRSRRAKGPVWQPRYFDRIVRDVREYHKTMEYMHLNPVRERIGQQARALVVVQHPLLRWRGSG